MVEGRGGAIIILYGKWKGTNDIFKWTKPLATSHESKDIAGIAASRILFWEVIAR